MNVFWHELNMMRASALWWLIGLLGTALLFLSLFPSFTHDVEASKKLLESFPPSLQAAIGLSADTFFSFFGFYAYALTYVALVAAVYACYTGLTIFGKETLNKTTDFLLTKPISRSTLFASKYMSALVTVMCVGILLQIGTFGMAYIFGATFDTGTYLLFSGSVLLIQVWFVAIGVMVSIILPRIKNVITIALAIPFGFLMIGMVGAVVGDDALRYITPFKYIDYSYVSIHHAYEWSYIAVGAVTALLFVAVSFWLYRTRDAKAVA